MAAALLAALVAWGAQRALGPRVRTLRPTRREVVQTVVASGRVLAPGEVSLGAMLSGVVRAVNAAEGDRVAAGQVLVEFDDRELAAQVAQARAGLLLADSRVGQVQQVSARVAGESVRQAEANLRAAEQTLARQEGLQRSGALAPAELESAQRAVDVARSQLRAARITAAGAMPGGSDARSAVAGRAQAEATLRVAEARLAQAKITAPAPGVVMRRSVEPGDVVTPGRVLMVLLQDGATEVQITPDERNLADLRLGQRALASTEAFPDQSFPAVVTYLAPVIDAQRGTVEVRLRVPDPPPYLRPAMTVSVEVEVRRRAGALTLPLDAVRDAARSAPWVMVFDRGRAVRRAVRLGLRGREVLEVTSGLRDGEAVIPSGEGAEALAGRRVRLRAAP